MGTTRHTLRLRQYAFIDRVNLHSAAIGIEGPTIGISTNLTPIGCSSGTEDGEAQDLYGG